MQSKPSLLSEPISDFLKKTTQINHQQLEKAMVKQLRLVKTNADYIKLLQVFYSYFGALEYKINLYISPDNFDKDFQRRKATRLINDIKMMGGEINQKVQNEDLPQIENSLQAFGALYVLEGSTLGGRIIVKMLQRQLNDSENSRFTFFTGYNEETESRWASFKELLNHQTRTEQEVAQVLGAANETFLKFALCFEKIYG